jgi:hypothetical protein
LTAAGGSNIDIMGECRIEMGIFNTPTVIYVIVAQISVPAIPGMDFLRDTK